MVLCLTILWYGGVTVLILHPENTNLLLSGLRSISSAYKIGVDVWINLAVLALALHQWNRAGREAR